MLGVGSRKISILHGSAAIIFGENGVTTIKANRDDWRGLCFPSLYDYGAPMRRAWLTSAANGKRSAWSDQVFEMPEASDGDTSDRIGVDMGSRRRTCGAVGRGLRQRPCGAAHARGHVGHSGQHRHCEGAADLGR